MKQKKTRPSPTSHPVPSISDAEWIVMREFWLRGELTVAQVVDHLARPYRWKPATIHTMITRLRKKGALDFTKRGREYIYRPAIAEEDCVHEVSRSFVDRVFGGKLAPLVACFAERENLSDADLRALRRILDDQES